MRGIRGATTAAANTREEILAATAELLAAMQEGNGFIPDDVTQIIFTSTPDLDSAFPAAAARQLGWKYVPVLDAAEPAVRGGLPMCIRALVTVDTPSAPSELNHVYLRGAKGLRPDLREGN